MKRRRNTEKPTKGPRKRRHIKPETKGSYDQSSDVDEDVEVAYFNDDEFSRLNSQFWPEKSKEVNRTRDSESDHEKNPEEIEQSIRDVWGRDRVAYYGSDEDSLEDDEDPEEIEDKLAEARRTHDARLASLNFSDFQSAMDLISATIEPQAAIADENKLALDSLLSEFQTPRSTLTSEQPEIMSSLAAKFIALCTDVKEESLRFLKTRPSKISRVTVDFLDLQLRVALWGSCLFSTAHAIGGFSSNLIEQFGSLAKAVRKLEKLSSLFEVQLARIRSLPVPATGVDINAEICVKPETDVKSLSEETKKSRLEIALELARKKKHAVAESLTRLKSSLLNSKSVGAEIYGSDRLVEDHDTTDDENANELGHVDSGLSDSDEFSCENVSVVDNENHGPAVDHTIVIDDDYDISYCAQLEHKESRIPDYVKDLDPLEARSKWFPMFQMVSF